MYSYYDTDDWDSDDEDDFKTFTGTALQMFLTVDPQSLPFMRYVHHIAKSIRHVYPNCRPIYYNRDMTNYKTFLSELKGFLKDMDCPFTEFTTPCIGIAIEHKFCRRRLLTYLNAEYASAIKYSNFYQKQVDKSESSSCEISKDTPATSSFTNEQDTVPNNERNVGPGEEQSSQIPQVVDQPAKKELVEDEPQKKELVEDEPTKREISIEKKFGELTIDTEQPFLSVTPTLQQNYALQVHRSTGVAQYGNIDNNFQQCGIMQGSMIQNGSYSNTWSNQNILPNQQQGYRSIFNHNFNFAFPRQQNTLSSQAVRPIQIDLIDPFNQTSLAIWNRQIQCNEGMLQGAHQNRGLNDYIRYNSNHQWNRNVPSPYSHNQNLNIAQQQDIDYRQGYWNTRGSGNIPITQNNQQGWISQGPRNTGTIWPLFGNSYNNQQVGRVQGGEYHNQSIYGNMQHQYNNQQSYRPPAYQTMSFRWPQEPHVSHGVAASYYIGNSLTYHDQEGGNGQSGITGVRALYSGYDNSIQRRDNMPHREYQNPSCNAQNTNSQGPRF